MKPLLFFAILFFLAIPTFANKVENPPFQDSPTIKKLWKQIEKDNVFDLERAVHGDDVRINQLRKGVSSFDLMKTVMDNPNGMVRIFAFAALAGQMDNLPEEIVRKVKEDHTLITVASGRTLKKIPFDEVANGFLK